MSHSSVSLLLQALHNTVISPRIQYSLYKHASVDAPYTYIPCDYRAGIHTQYIHQNSFVLLVRKTSVQDSDYPGNVLSGKVIIHETSVRENDCPGNVCKPSWTCRPFKGWMLLMLPANNVKEKPKALALTLLDLVCFWSLTGSWERNATRVMQAVWCRYPEFRICQDLNGL